ncbi:MAG: hypothetical protein IJ685_02085 [Selenomonadaceae bacterium]|nr:hypothetical protein [Selenomonadaceae bacterium]
MVDLKKSSDGTEMIRNELQALTATNQQLKGDLREINSDMQQIYSANYKLSGELDLLSYRLERLNSDTQEIRREVYEIKRTIEGLQYELIHELNRNRRSDSRNFPSLSMMLAIAFPAAMFAMIVLFIVLVTN